MATTQQDASVRKPLGVRATADEHRIIAEAAKREHRSISSFVLRAALSAAGDQTKVTRDPEEIDAAIQRAQDLMRRHRKPGHSLVDELIAERRAEAELE